ncbi:Ku protein [Streptomyces cacaoi]
MSNAEIGKGYEYAKDQVVAISDEELRDLPLPTAKAIEIDAFVAADDIDPIRIGEGYYLSPDGAGRGEAVQAAPRGAGALVEGGHRQIRMVRARAARHAAGPRRRHRPARDALA